MSYVTSLLAGKMKPDEFVSKSAEEVKKALTFLPAPWAQFLFDGLQTLLTSAGLGGTVAAIIVQAVKAAVYPPPAVPPAPPT